VSSLIRNKGLAFTGAFLILVGIERLLEWHFKGYAESGGPHMPKATGEHALVTGIVIVALGVWVAFASTRGKSNQSTEPNESKEASKSSP
jgi:uncharacterized membrane protein